MTVSSYDGWVADGEPWHPAPCIAALQQLLERHGYTVYTIGDRSHLTAVPPEDHTPYSHTPWPAGQPYPYVLALDIMPGGPVDWRRLGARIVADKVGGKPGTEWIKYVNWTDPADGRCWHSSWEPNHNEERSTDYGHVHISARSDLFKQADLRGWDPVADLLAGNDPTPTPPATAGPTPSEDLVNQLPTIQRGATGQHVRDAQGLLNAHGAILALDGVFGPLTDSATRSFQVVHQVANSVVNGHGDGQIGPHTWAALLDVA